MEVTDMKLYFINLLALIVTSTDIEMSLIILLICTIIYTIIKTKKLYDKKNG